MKKPPLPFDRSPKCPKCEHYIASSDVQYNAKKDVLQLKCGYECKYKFTMLPADRRAERKERVRY